MRESDTNVAGQPTPAPTNPQPPPFADAIQATIKAIVDFLLEAGDQHPELRRSLCRLAQTHGLAAEEFRHRLVQAGLPYPHASELKCLLLAPAALAQFLDPVKPVAWRKSLAAARAEADRREGQMDALTWLASRVAATLWCTARPYYQVGDCFLTVRRGGGNLDELANAPTI